MATRDTYTKVHEHWEDQPSEKTPVFAADLEHIEQGIKDSYDNRALKEIYGDDGVHLNKGEATGDPVSIMDGEKSIHALDWQGNAKFAGDVTNGAGISLNSLKSAIDNMEVIAAGGSIAKVFDTKADLDAWLLVEGNPETLKVGQNIYIADIGTPDYWWDGKELQILETDKVTIETMTYDETMAILNAAGTGEVA